MPVDITLDGAQAGVDASSASSRTDPSDESIIDAPLDSAGDTQSPVRFTGTTGGTVDGFTLTQMGNSGGGAGTATPAISALGGAGAGSFQWDDNIVTGNGEGYQLSTGDTPGARSTIEGNRFVDNDGDASDPLSGTGVFLSNGASDDLTISGNAFDDEGSTGNGEINTTGDGGSSSGCTDPSTGLEITGNSPDIDASDGTNFLVLFCTTGATVSGNTVTQSDSVPDSAFYLGGGDSGPTLSGNTVSGGDQAAGVSLNSDFYPAGTGDVISDNTISGRSNGIVVRPSVSGNGDAGYSGFTLSGNTVTGSVDRGIWVEAGDSGGVVSDNSASGSGTYDCEDDTSGAGTSGTADNWSGDSGASSDPAGLCAAAPPTATPEAPLVVALPLAAGAAGLVVLRRRRRRGTRHS